jgi:hypothetical protein
MLTPEERALLLEQQDRLIELLTERQESTKETPNNVGVGDGLAVAG